MISRAPPLVDIETPVPIVYLDRLERNIARAAEYARAHGLTLRPHVKTHKSTSIAERQMRAGATGLSCATPREMEVMQAVSSDLLFAYPPIGESKLRRLVSLAPDVRVTVALDSAEAVAALGAAAARTDRSIGVYVELDVGLHRVGTQSVAEAIALIQAVMRHKHLSYRGIAFYPGHIREPVTNQVAKLERLNQQLALALDQLDRADVRPAVVSAGSTPTLWRSHELVGVTECRPGTYVYNDRTTADIGACDFDDCAAMILATVVSTAVPGQAVIGRGR